MAYADRAGSSVSLNVYSAPGCWVNYTGDKMFDSDSYNSYTTITLTFSGMEAGTYRFYLYGHGAADNQNSTFVLNGQSQSTAVGPYWNNNQLINGAYRKQRGASDFP